MRLFVGIELDAGLPAAMDAAIEPLRSRLKHACPDLPIRWVPSQNLHLTLVFIGAVGAERYDTLLTTLDLPVPAEPFDLTLAGLGIFPPSGPPAVIWLGVVSGGERLAIVQRDVSNRLAAVGLDQEKRRYVPHVTLARLKPPTGWIGRVARQVVRDAVAPSVVSHVGAVTLFRSDQSAQGSSYQPLKRLPLQR